MKTTLITGNNNSGKTRYLLERLSGEGDNLFITNDSSVFYIEKYFASHKIIGKVVGVSSLVKSIQEEIGGTVEELISDDMQAVLISDIMLRNKDKLSTLKISGYNNGLAFDVASFINDCMANRILPETLEAAMGEITGNEYHKLEDIVFIYREWLKEAKEKGVVNNVQLHRMLAEKLILSNHTYKNVYIDSLNSYGLPVMDLLKAVATKAENLYCAFTVINPSSFVYDIYKESNQAYVEFDKFLIGMDGNWIERVNLKPENKKDGISIIRKELFNRDTNTVSSDKSVVLHEASTVYKEIEFISYKIKELVKNGATLDDIVVTGSSLVDYRNIINDSFKRSGIRSYYYKTNSFQKTDVYSFISHLFEVCENGLTSESIVYFLSCGYMGFEESEVISAKNFFLRFGDDIEIAFKNGEVYDNSEYIIVKNIIDRLSDKLSEFFEKLKSCETYENYCEATYSYMTSLEIDQKLFDGYRDYLYNNPQFANWLIESWNCIVDIIDKINILKGEDECDSADFYALFDRLSSGTYIRNSQEYCDEVKILDLNDAENRRSKYVFVMGCVEGRFPYDYPEGLVLDKEIRILNGKIGSNLESSENRRNRDYYAIYSALTAASDTVFISWHINDEDARPLRFASVLNNVVKTFEENLEKEKRYYNTDKEAAFYNLLNNLSEYKKTGKVIEGTDDEYWEFSNDSMYSERLADAISNGVLDKEQINLEEETGCYKEDKFFAVTRLEKFNQCPFKHFVEFGLLPQYQKLFEETAANKGTFYHSVLSELFNRLNEDSVNIKKLSYDEYLVIINKVIEDMLKVHNENVLESNIELVVEKDKMIRKIIASAWASIQQLNAGAFSVLKTEFKVGRDIPLRLSLSDGTVVNIIGTIDRIDETKINGEKYVRVIDYKSGTNTFSSNKIELGLQLQLPLYLKSIIGDRLPAGMYYSNLVDPVADLDNHGETLMKKAQLNGPTVGELSIVENSDYELLGIGVSSNVIQAEITNKGELSKRSKTMEKEQFDELVEKAVEKAVETIEKINNFETKANPRKITDYNACDYCNYKTICHRR